MLLTLKNDMTLHFSKVPVDILEEVSMCPFGMSLSAKLYTKVRGSPSVIGAAILVYYSSAFIAACKASYVCDHRITF